MPTSMRGRNRSAERRRSSALMTIEELCEDLGISRSTFYDWRAKRKAPSCIKLPNGELRIHRVEYNTWLENLAVRAA